MDPMTTDVKDSVCDPSYSESSSLREADRSGCWGMWGHPQKNKRPTRLATNSAVHLHFNYHKFTPCHEADLDF